MACADRRRCPACWWCSSLTPPVRAAVADWFGFGGVQVRYDPSASPPPGAALPACRAPVSAAEAGRRAGFVPRAPRALGEPDAVSVSAVPGGRGTVSLCWYGRAGSTVRLDEFPARLDLGFVKQVRIMPAVAGRWAGGRTALWFAEPHVLQVPADRRGRAAVDRVAADGGADAAVDDARRADDAAAGGRGRHGTRAGDRGVRCPEDIGAEEVGAQWEPGGLGRCTRSDADRVRTVRTAPASAGGDMGLLRRLAALVALLGLTLGAALFLAPGAVAGGPTSVLIVSPESGEAAALYASATGVRTAVRRCCAPARAGGKDRPPALDVVTGVRQINVTWMVHDISPWRLDRVYRPTTPARSGSIRRPDCRIRTTGSGTRRRSRPS